MESVSDFPQGLVAVVRSDSLETARLIVRGLAGAGVNTIELTTTTPSYLSLLAELTSNEALRVGVGTVLTEQQVASAADNGATFLVAPDFNPPVVQAAIHRSLPMAPGGLTPTEIRSAHEAGATAVKVFPVGSMGGPAYVKALLEPLPHIRLVVSGGISLAEYVDYTEVGAHAICLGSALINRQAADAGDLDEVVRHAREALRTFGISEAS